MCTIIKYANFHIIEKCSNLFSNNNNAYIYSNNDNIASHKWIAFPIFDIKRAFMPRSASTRLCKHIETI